MSTHTNDKKYSFYSLFKQEHRLRISIPIIQRDYAQGRKDQEEVRETFVKALHGYITDATEASHNLDFVYGAYGQAQGSAFFPLDGQQRLTTLYLLHWYLAQTTADQDLRKEFYDALYDSDSQRSRFGYETRPSSRDFCDALLRETLQTPLRREDKSALSEVLKDQPWFNLSWAEDPTIDGMLTMLDTIDKHFADAGDLLGRLLSTDKPAITFEYMDLKGFGLTDELYIKMNARGKQLTPFEHLKAQLEQYFRQEIGDAKAETFARKMDQEWADLYWAYRNEVSQDNTYDDELNHTLQLLIGYHYILHTQSETSNAKEALEVLLTTERQLSCYDYERVGALAPGLCQWISSVLDALCNGTDKIRTYLQPHYYAEEAMFVRMMKRERGGWTHAYRALFFAYLTYLVEHGRPTTAEEREQLHQWMRVMHNLCHPDNHALDDANAYARLVRSIWSLRGEASRIIEVLRETHAPIWSSFPRHQQREEQVKARLISLGAEWQEVIERAELHDYFRGQIAFVLELAGLENANIQGMSAEAQSEALERLKHYTDLTAELFRDGYQGRRKHDPDYCLERAVLTEGNYLIANEGDVWGCRYLNLYSSTEIGGNIYRDYSWRRCMSTVYETPSKEESYHNRCHARRLLLATLQDSRLQLGSVIEGLKRMIDEDGAHILEHDPRGPLVRSPKLFRVASQGYVYLKRQGDGFAYRLVGSSSIRGYNAELFSFELYVRHWDYEGATCPLGEVTYEWERGRDTEPDIYLGQWQDLDAYLVYSTERDASRPWKLRLLMLHVWNGEAIPDHKPYLKRLGTGWVSEHMWDYYGLQTSFATEAELCKEIDRLDTLTL